jgi:PHP family Zn ribbon phosphoesterase
LIPLQEIIADVLKVGKQSKKVQGAYLSYIEQASEYELLVEKNKAELTTLLGDAVAWAVIAVREGKVAISPGYDGLYGTIKIDYQEYNTDK